MTISWFDLKQKYVPLLQPILKNFLASQKVPASYFEIVFQQPFLAIIKSHFIEKAADATQKSVMANIDLIEGSVVLQQFSDDILKIVKTKFKEPKEKTQFQDMQVWLDAAKTSMLDIIKTAWTSASDSKQANNLYFNAPHTAEFFNIFTYESTTPNALNKTFGVEAIDQPLIDLERSADSYLEYLSENEAPNAVVEMCWVLIRENRLAEAIKYGEEIFKLGTLSAGAPLARIFWKKNEIEKARHYFEAALPFQSKTQLEYARFMIENFSEETAVIERNLRLAWKSGLQEAGDLMGEFLFNEPAIYRGFFNYRALFYAKAYELPAEYGGFSKRRAGTVYFFNYEVKNAAGEILDTHFGKQPAYWMSNTNKYVQGVTEALVKMRPGEKLDLRLPPELAFGHHDPKMIISLSMTKKKVGDWHHITDCGREIYGRIIAVNDVESKVDFNHPLVDQFLDVHLELVEVRPVIGEEFSAFYKSEFGTQPTLSILRPHYS